MDGWRRHGASGRLVQAALLVGLIVSEGLPAQLVGGSFSLDPVTIDAGAVRACEVVGCIAPMWELQGTLGQLEAGRSGSGIDFNSGWALFGGFWYAQNPAGSTPVTLAEVSSERLDAHTIRLHWWSSTEVGFVGFEVQPFGSGTPLRNSWIMGRGDSLRPQSYRGEAQIAANAFVLRAHDIDGSVRVHGPFVVGQHYGSDASADVQVFDHGAARQALENTLAARSRQVLRNQTAAALRLEVDRSGWQSLDYAQLQAAGAQQFDGLPVAELALVRHGAPVAFEVESSDAQWGPGDRLGFFAEALDTLYSRTAVFELRHDSELARRYPLLETQAIGPTRITALAQQRRESRAAGYSFSAPGVDPWWAERLLSSSASGAVVRDLSLSADALAPGGAAQVLNLKLWGGTNFAGSIPDHHVQIELNGVLLADRRFDGLIEVSERLALPPGLLQPGSNQLRLRLPQDHLYPADVIYLDQLELGYQRELSVHADGMLQLSLDDSTACQGGTAHLFEDRFGDPLTAGSTCPGLQLAGLDPDASGWRVLRRRGDEMALLQGLPAAIDGKMELALANQSGDRLVVLDRRSWNTPTLRCTIEPGDPAQAAADYLVISHPLFVDALAPLLAAKQAQGLRPRVVSTEAIYAAYSAGEVDPQAIATLIRQMFERHRTRYVLLVGSASSDPLNHLGSGSVDFVPTLYRASDEVVRFAPVDAAYADLDGDLLPELAIGRWPVRSLVELDHLLDKQQRYAADGLASKVLLVADRQATEGNFRQQSEQLAPAFAPRTLTRVYRDLLDVSSARQQLLAALGAGQGYVQYLGHASPSRWAFDNLLTAAQISSGALGNAAHPALVLQWGCWNSYHVDPQVTTMAHAWLNSIDGAVASVGAATLTDAGRGAALAQHFLRALNQKLPGTTLGEALVQAKRALGGSAEHRDVLLGISLLGDPALPLH